MMKLFGVASLCVLAILGAAGIADTQPSVAPIADLAAGAQLFRAHGCIDWHAGDVERFRQQLERRAIHAD
jgi:hypothetical protein